MFSQFGFILLASILSIASARAAVYTVGADGACTHTTIAAAAAAAEAHPGPDTINIASNQVYTAQAVVFSASQPLDLVGGFADCSQAASDSSHTVIDGAGGITDPVFRITVPTGGLVKLSYLTIQHGDEDGSGKGGGIYVKGNGILELDHATVTQNIAGYGGGIYAEGTGTETELVIGEDVAIVGNTARYNGGGVVNDGTEMTMTQPDSYIANNEAQGVLTPPLNEWIGGNGGGLLVTSASRKAYTYLGSTGFGRAGAIYLNSARRGGGVAVLGSNDIAQLQVFSTDPARPMRIKGNSASVDGGGVYLGIGGDEFARADLVAWFVYIEDNIAPAGAAIAVRNSDGISDGVVFNGPANRPLGSIDCPVGKPCGGINGNTGIDDASQPTGGIVQVSAYGFTRFYRITFEGNSGQYLFRGDGGDGAQAFETHHVAITGNTTSSNLISAGDNGAISLQNTTIAGNAVGASTVMRFGNAYAHADQLYRSIIWQPGKTTLDLTGGPPLDLLDLMVSERTSVDGGNTPYVTVRDPRFVDPANGDYSLIAGSPAVDYSGNVAGDSTDLYGNPRDVDLPILSNYHGVRDLGAIERQTLQPLVLNSDFDTDLRLWSEAIAGLTTRDPTRNISGAAGSGSVHISSPANAVPGTRFGALVQCVHLPGPGIYALNGWGHGTGTAVTGGDIAELYWEYRKSGGEGCTNGAADASGTKILSSSNNWSKPATPAFIEVTAQDFTYTSSIAVTLVAEENGPSGAPTNAWFDGITLSVGGDDVIFANGFDGP
ncbi:MAG: hypothetical protein ABIQ70_04805 [Dokdonella sp.]